MTDQTNLPVISRVLLNTPSGIQVSPPVRACVYHRRKNGTDQACCNKCHTASAHCHSVAHTELYFEGRAIYCWIVQCPGCDHIYYIPLSSTTARLNQVYRSVDHAEHD